jgi:Uma2 family endonuclease
VAPGMPDQGGQDADMTSIPLTTESVAEDCLVLNVENVALSDEQFLELCSDNREFEFELTAQKELVIMTPPGGRTGKRQTNISYDLENWSRQDGRGITFAPNTLFALPNGAKRGPDACWLSLERWNAFTREQQEGPLPLCPKFVLELVSKSQRRKLKMQQAKMDEYIANGALLGWLINPYSKTVDVYRPGQPVERLVNPSTISGDPVLAGFVLTTSEIFT